MHVISVLGYFVLCCRFWAMDKPQNINFVSSHYLVLYICTVYFWAIVFFWITHEVFIFKNISAGKAKRNSVCISLEKKCGVLVIRLFLDPWELQLALCINLAQFIKIPIRILTIKLRVIPAQVDGVAQHLNSIFLVGNPLKQAINNT